MSFVEKLSTMLKGCSPILNLSFQDQVSEKVRWWKATEEEDFIQWLQQRAPDEEETL